MKLYSSHIAFHGAIQRNRPGKPFLLMLHGFMGSGRAFHPMMTALEKFSNPATLDLLGHGLSGGATDPARYRAGKQAEDLRSILGRFRFTPLILYGYSMGGRLALHFAQAFPNLVDGLILESTSFGLTGPAERCRRVMLDNERADAIEADYDAFLNDWQAGPLFQNRSGPKKDHYRKLMEEQNPIFLAASLRGFGSGVMKPLYDQLTDFHVPTLLLCGNEDTKFVSINRKMNSRMPHAKLKIVAGASHRVHFDQPDRCATEIETFIKQLKK